MPSAMQRWMKEDKNRKRVKISQLFVESTSYRKLKIFNHSDNGLERNFLRTTKSWKRQVNGDPTDFQFKSLRERSGNRKMGVIR